MTSHETYYSVDSKLRALHGQPWPSSSSSFYMHHPGTQPSSATYSTSGDSNSEYKHPNNDGNHGHHGDLGGKGKKQFSYHEKKKLESDWTLIKAKNEKKEKKRKLSLLYRCPIFR